MADSLIQHIEADIAETERLITELRLRIAVGQSAGEDTSKSERRVQEILKGWMLLQDQLAKASREAQQDRDPKPTRSREISGPAVSTAGRAGRADGLQ